MAAKETSTVAFNFNDVKQDIASANERIAQLRGSL
jgi:hypothetical protein